MKRLNLKLLAAVTLTVLLFSGCAFSQKGKTSASSSGGTSSSSKSSQAASSSSPASSSNASSSSAVSSFPAPEKDPLYVEAFNDYAAHKYDSAVQVSDEALSKNPECFWAYNIKGIALYFANGNSYADRCMKMIDQSIAINPQYGYGYFNKALILKGLKRFDESIACFDKVLALNPDDTWSYFGISTIYADENQLDPALEYLKKAIDLDPSVKDTAKTESHFVKWHGNAKFEALVNS